MERSPARKRFQSVSKSRSVSVERSQSGSGSGKIQSPPPLPPLIISSPVHRKSYETAESKYGLWWGGGVACSPVMVSGDPALLMVLLSVWF